MNAIKRSLVAAVLGWLLGGCAQFSPVRYHLDVQISSDGSQGPQTVQTNAQRPVIAP